MKKLIAALTGICLIASVIPASLTNTAYASYENGFSADELVIELSLEDIELSELEDYEEELVEELKKQDPKDFEEFLEEYISDNENIVASKLEDEGLEYAEAILVNGSELSSSYEINDETTLEVTSEGFVLDVFEEGEERIATLDEELHLYNIEESESGFVSSIGGKIKEFFSSTAYASSAKSKPAEHSRTVYSFYGTKLYTAAINATFTYDNTKVTAVRNFHYIKRHFDGAIYSIYDTKSGVKKPSSKFRTAYQQGMVSWGLHIKGHGLVFNEKFIQVNVSCDHKGTVTKSSVLR